MLLPPILNSHHLPPLHQRAGHWFQGVCERFSPRFWRIRARQGFASILFTQPTTFRFQQRFRFPTDVQQGALLTPSVPLSLPRLTLGQRVGLALYSSGLTGFANIIVDFTAGVSQTVTSLASAIRIFRSLNYDVKHPPPFPINPTRLGLLCVGCNLLSGCKAGSTAAQRC